MPKPLTKRGTLAATAPKYEFDVCLSFAGEDRPCVQRVANCLKRRGIRYFYDNEQEATLLGKDLFVYLDEIYQHKSRFCAMFLSRHYKIKRWTNHERQSAQARAFVDDEDYVLPFRLDATPIAGIRPTLGYSDASNRSPSHIADIIAAKVNGETVAALRSRRLARPKAARVAGATANKPNLDNAS